MKFGNRRGSLTTVACFGLSFLAVGLVGCASSSDEDSSTTLTASTVSWNWCEAIQACDPATFESSFDSLPECQKDGVDELGDLLTERSDECEEAALHYFDCALSAVVCGGTEGDCPEERAAAETACDARPSVAEGSPSIEGMDAGAPQE